QQVRSKPGDAKLRVFLFQLLCVLGQWQRASTQLQACGELDAGALAMVATYREALQCEVMREAVFAGKTTPHVFGHPQAWVPLLTQALVADARGDAAGAGRLRTEALDQAPATAGTLNGQPFEWIADADSRLGPMLEAVINGRYCWVPFDNLTRVSIEPPEDLRDLVWAPCHLGLKNGGETVALIPTRYAGSGNSADAGLQMSRKTEWESIGGDHFRGLGQRVLTSSGPELGLLEIREIVISPTSASSSGDEDAVH
ncbi:MAG TPA: type VI secretion system accessory protein TagJ, partial [Rubrivivax sp.]|nr:type VI secretion system accessory protein TagJ [Rubrivivax sp.]